MSRSPHGGPVTAARPAQRSYDDSGPRPDELSCLLRRLRVLVLQPQDSWSPEVITATRVVAQSIAERLRAMDSDPWVP